MKDWKRISLVSFALIGSVAFFGYWSINQFNNTFDNLSASSLANVSYVTRKPPIPQPPKQDVALATSTNFDDLELSFTFPQKGDSVYIGCTYLISWHSSTTINSLASALIDTGTEAASGPVASGLAKENSIEKDSQNLRWKVGVVWPGEYYIKTSKLNDIEKEFRSDTFTINEMPEDMSIEKRENMCE